MLKVIQRLLTKNSYKGSAKALLYETIAQECGSTPQHVYNLAHGGRCVDYTDDKIITALIRHGIIGYYHDKRTYW